jgi:hypothetical protein
MLESAVETRHRNVVSGEFDDAPRVHVYLAARM